MGSYRNLQAFFLVFEERNEHFSDDRIRSPFGSPGRRLNALENVSIDLTSVHAGRGSSVGCASVWYAGGHGFDPHVRQHSFVEIGHEIMSMAILSLPLSQEGQLSVTGERICAKYR